MPPSCVLIVFANEWNESAYDVFHCSAISTSAVPSVSVASKYTTLCSGSRPSGRDFTQCPRPPVALKTSLDPSRTGRRHAAGEVEPVGQAQDQQDQRRHHAGGDQRHLP